MREANRIRMALDLTFGLWALFAMFLILMQNGTAFTALCCVLLIGWFLYQRIDTPRLPRFYAVELGVYAFVAAVISPCLYYAIFHPSPIGSDMAILAAGQAAILLRSFGGHLLEELQHHDR